MSVTISGNDGQPEWRYRNGIAGALLARVAAVAGHLADLDWEIKFAKFLGIQDQTICGSGCIGFDLDQLPWSTRQAEFERQRRFAIETTRFAAEIWCGKLTRASTDAFEEEKQSGWLRELADLIAGFEISKVAGSIPREWDFWLDPTDKRCPEHGAFKHAHGCLICNELGENLKSSENEKLGQQLLERQHDLRVRFKGRLRRDP